MKVGINLQSFGNVHCILKRTPNNDVLVILCKKKSLITQLLSSLGAIGVNGSQHMLLGNKHLFKPNNVQFIIRWVAFFLRIMPSVDLQVQRRIRVARVCDFAHAIVK